MKSSEPIIILTSGEPAGIGPDICGMLAKEEINKRIVIICDHEIMLSRLKLLNLQVKVKIVKEVQQAEIHKKNTIQLLHISKNSDVKAGILNKNNSKYVLDMINLATRSCINNNKIGMINCPVQKSIINEYGYKFNGHTDYIAKLCGVSAPPVMMLASNNIRIALATTHIPLREVADNINTEQLRNTIKILLNALREKFSINKPKIAILGLNPHAGESGYLGEEEINIIKPIISEFRKKEDLIDGPFPADTAFNPKMRDYYDAYIAMYHDQGLPVLKALHFGNIVNITLGLPITRGSVDHGTALNLAGTGKADISSLLFSINQIHEIL